MKNRVVRVYQINYYLRTKHLYDIVTLPMNQTLSARTYYEAIKHCPVKQYPISYIYGSCGQGWATIGGGEKEFDLSSYRDI